MAMIFSDKPGRTAFNWIEIADLAAKEAKRREPKRREPKRISGTAIVAEMRDFYRLGWAADGASRPASAEENRAYGSLSK